MAIPEKNRSLLVADSDGKFVKVLSEHPRTKEYPIKIAITGADAQKIICNQNELLMGIFVSRSMQNPPWISVVRCAHMNRPATPLFFIQENKDDWSEITQDDLKKIGIKATVTKASSYEELIKLVAPIALSFDGNTAIQRAQQNKDVLGSETQASEKEFVSISAEDFLSGSKSFFDVYVKLPAGKYIKLLQAGDVFTADRLENYLKKGVTHFYIKKEIQEQYVSYCDHIASALLKSKDVSTDIKVSQTLNHGEEVLKHLKNSGVSEVNLKHAAKFVNNTRELVTQLTTGLSKTDLLGSFMANVTAFEHGVGTSMLAGVLAAHLQIASENPVQIIGMAAMLHDVGLGQMPELFLLEDESLMNAEQKKLFRTHPTVAAEALSAQHRFHPGAIQAIQQHHMRIGIGKGFPDRTGTTPVSRISEIIGICDELNRLMQRCEKDKKIDIIKKIESEIFPCFSRAVVEAFKTAFYPTQFQSTGILKSNEASKG